jgi:hypothetical protein
MFIKDSLILSCYLTFSVPGKYLKDDKFHLTHILLHTYSFQVSLYGLPPISACVTENLPKLTSMF